MIEKSAAYTRHNTVKTSQAQVKRLLGAVGCYLRLDYLRFETSASYIWLHAKLGDSQTI